LRRFEKDQIGIKELFAIMFITMSTKASDASTLFLFRDGLNAAWIILLGSFMLILPSLFLLNSVLKKYESKNILEITQLTLGRPIAYLIAFFMVSFFLLNTASDARSYMTQLITINFPNTPLFVLLVLFLFLCMWGAKKGWESICSVAWMFFPYLIVTLGLLTFLLMKDAIFPRIFPLLGTGGWELTKASFRYTSLVPEPFIVAMMYPFVKNHKTYTRGLYTSLIFTLFVMVLAYLSYVWVFDYRSLIKITFPFNEAIRLVSLGKMITHVEQFFISVWLLSAFIKFAAYIYVVCSVFGFLFSIKDFEHTILPVGILILMLAMIPENNENNVFLIREMGFKYVKFLILCLPPLLWVASKIKEGRKN
jgi:spore germination protein KB